MVKRPLKKEMQGRMAGSTAHGRAKKRDPQFVRAGMSQGTVFAAGSWYDAGRRRLHP